jgi:cobalt-zinc-cadmium efflux system membrane fusion protein
LNPVEANTDGSPKAGEPGSRRTIGPGLALVLILVAAGLGIGGYRLIINSSSRAAPALPAAAAPQLLREGQRIIIPEKSPLRAKLIIDPVQEKEIQRTLVLPAVVEADPAHLVKVLPPLAGRITQLKVQLGERVEAGQALVVLDSPDLGTAYADHERAAVVLDLALKNRDRARSLAKIGGAATRDLQQAETDYVTAEVEHQRADARLKQIGVDPEVDDKSRTVTIKSPIAGSIIDLSVAPGTYWNDTTAPLMTVADLSSIWVTANVPEKDTTLISKGQAVEVVFPAYPNEIFKGTVLFVSDILDADTRRTKVRIAFPNPDIRLKPNMFASVRFLAPRQTSPAIPTAAVVLNSSNDTEQVFVEVAPWTFEARPVEVGSQDGPQTVVQKGLKPGERVVVKGGVLLND